MASISIVITGNENGVMNKSYNISEQDLARITKSLRAMYKGRQEEALTDIDVFDILSESLVRYIFDTCYETEVSLKIQEFKAANPVIALR